MDLIYEVYANRKIFNVPNILIGDRIFFFGFFWGGTFADVISFYIVLVLDFLLILWLSGGLGKSPVFYSKRYQGGRKGVSKKRVDVLELPRGRLYPLFSGNNDISLCKGSKCRDDC